MARTHVLTIVLAFSLMGLRITLDQNITWHLTSDTASAPVGDSVQEMESYGVR